jgi:hypothetical protein
VGAILCSAASASSAEEPLKLADAQLEPAKWTERSARARYGRGRQPYAVAVAETDVCRS